MVTAESWKDLLPSARTEHLGRNRWEEPRGKLGTQGQAVTAAWQTPWSDRGVEDATDTGKTVCFSKSGGVVSTTPGATEEVPEEAGAWASPGFTPLLRLSGYQKLTKCTAPQLGP